jgi:competence protein ComEC
MSASVWFVDVGQGDCTIAVDESTHEAILIDCPSSAGLSTQATLATAGAQRLRSVFVTHTDLDHLGGIVTVVTGFPTDVVFVNLAPAILADPQDRPKLRAILRSLAALPTRGIDVRPALAGANGYVGAINWTILAPSQAQLFQAQALGSSNHASVVTSIEIESVRFLVTGDAEERRWRQMIDDQFDLRADVFLIPHHGAGLAQALGADIAEVLDAVLPRFFVLSVGRTNQYGHPSPQTLREIMSRAEDGRVFVTQWRSEWEVDLPRKLLGGIGTSCFSIDSSILTSSAF